MIELKDVSFHYMGEVKNGVDNVNLKIQAGECVLFCGRSGCGKTTITRLINGLIPNFYEGELQGKVFLNGQDIKEIPMYKMSEMIGSVFQSPKAQFFNVDTDSEIAFGVENLSLPQEKIEERVNHAVSALNIEGIMGKNVLELSGGEKQKVAIASIYAMSPQVYVMDEPSSNLDMDAIEELKKILKYLKEMGKTIIIAEHRVYYLKDIVDRVIYIEDGKLQDEFTREQFNHLSKVERIEKGLRDSNLEQIQLPDKTINGKKRKRLELNNLNVCYKKKCVLSNINYTAYENDIVGVIGHNGAGKTTLMRTLCGLHKDYGGQIICDGNQVKQKALQRSSYMVMQEVGYQLFADSVINECGFGIKNPDYDLIRHTLKELGLEKYKEKHPYSLSGGQKQRVAAAVSKICRKNILIFDEPTSGLDFDSMVKVSDLVKKLARENKVIFVVTHDYEFLMNTCSRILHLDKAGIAEAYDLNVHTEKRVKGFFLNEKETKQCQIRN